MREYKGYNGEEVNKCLKIVDELMQKPLTVLQQINEFKERTGGSRSLFFRYKSYLRNKSNTIGNQKYQRYKGDSCYFCRIKESLIIHHINSIHSDNRKDNLLTLCSRCHNRIHVVMNKLNKSRSRSDLISEVSV